MNPKSLPLLLFALFLLASSVGVAHADEWQELRLPTEPDPRFGCTLVTYAFDLIMFGGMAGTLGNDLWVYTSGEVQRWVQFYPENPPPARYGHAATVVDGKMYIYGGKDGEGNVLNDMWAYDIEANIWEEVSAANLPPARSDHILNTLLDGLIVTAGGMGSAHTPLSDTWVLDTVASSWTQGADFPGPYGGAYGACTAVHGDEVHVFGTTDDVYVYDVTTDSWGTITPGGTTPPIRVLGASAQVGSSTVEYLFGGEDENGNILNDIWRFNYDSNTWTREHDMPVALSRSAAATFVSQSQSQHVLLFGGLQSDFKPTNRTFVYIPGIAVNKTVFDETAGEWVDSITAELNETVRFRFVVLNSGTDCNLTDITVMDILSDSLEYRDNATVDGVAHEPTPVSENEYKWEFAGPLASCEAITIEFDARVIECGNDRNRQNASAWCEEIGVWVYDEDTVWVNCTEVPPVCVETATGSGIACFETDAGTIEDLVAVDESTLPEEGKPALVFPHGFFSFNITGLALGQTVIVTIQLPDNVPVGTQYWKYHASEGGWVKIPMGSDDGDNVITITLVDGGLGDDDGAANGVIADQGGPGIPKPDLVITEKYETFVDGGSFNITYKVNNIGCADAGASNTTIYIDGVPLEVPTPAIPRGECHENTVGPFDCPCGVTLNVTVCADNDNVVDESNETNNCKVNEVECPAGIPGIEVNKTVWDPETGQWVEEITACICDIVRFRCEIHNSGTCCDLFNITVMDTLSDSLEFVGVQGGTPDPDEVIKNPDGSTTRIWFIPGPLAPCNSLTFLIDAHVTKCGEDWNKQNATADTTCGESVYDEDYAYVTVLPKLDLVITEKWLCWPDNCTICYNVTNIGEGTAPACHNTALYVDDVEVAHDHVPVDLGPGESYTGCFNGYVWQYTPPSDDITVCADNNETVDELDEDNNCLTNIWMCGDVNCDGKVTMSDVRKVFNRYLDPSYPLDLPWAADVNCDGKVTMSDVRKVFNRYLDPGYELNCCCGGGV